MTESSSVNYRTRIEVAPVAWSRPRTTNWVGFGANRRRINKPIVFNDPGLTAFERTVRQRSRADGPTAPLVCAVKLTLTFWLVRPKKPSKKARPYPLVRPDLSNYVKSVEDALNKVWFVDDSQIVDLVVSKRYADHNGIAAIEILMTDPDPLSPVV